MNGNNNALQNFPCVSVRIFSRVTSDTRVIVLPLFGGIFLQIATHSTFLILLLNNSKIRLNKKTYLQCTKLSYSINISYFGNSSYKFGCSLAKLIKKKIKY